MRFRRFSQAAREFMDIGADFDGAGEEEGRETIVMSTIHPFWDLNGGHVWLLLCCPTEQYVSVQLDGLYFLFGLCVGGAGLAIGARAVPVPIPVLRVFIFFPFFP